MAILTTILISQNANHAIEHLRGHLPTLTDQLVSILLPALSSSLARAYLSDSCDNSSHNQRSQVVVLCSIEYASYSKDPCPSHTLANRADNGSARHNC